MVSEIYYFIISGIDILWQIKKETSKNLPLFDSPKATSNRVPGPGHRTDEITSPTASIVYLNELKYVNPDLYIHYPSYFMEQSSARFLQKVLPET